MSINKARYIRRHLLEYPDATAEQIDARAVADGVIQDGEVFATKQGLYNARSELLKHLQLANLNEVPHHKVNGKPDTSKLIERLFLLWGNDVSWKKISSSLTFLGLNATQKRIEEFRPTGDSPDLNQNSGPRAGAPKSTDGRRRKSRTPKAARKADTVVIAALKLARDFVDEVGGIEQARLLIGFLEQFQIRN